MQLSKLKMTDFRGFATAEMALDSRLNLLVGENGAGKTSVLRAAQLLLGQVVREFVKNTAIRVPKIEAEDYRSYVQVLSNGKNRRKVSDKISLTGYVDISGGGFEVSYGKKTQEVARTSFFNTFKMEKCLPVFAFYGAHRGAIRMHISNKKKKPIDYYDPTSAYIEALNSDAGFQQFVDWFKRWEEDELRDVREGLPASRELNAVRRALESLFSDSEVRYVSPRVLPRGVGLVFTRINRDGSRMEMPFDQLSDGYRSMVALVADFARRLAIAYQESEADPLLGEGILIIDEIDLHLHPRWQQRVLHDLRRTFPNVQLITSTHAPEVIASVPRENVYCFVPSPEDPLSVTLEHPDMQTAGMGCEEVLPLVMEVTSQPPSETLDKFTKYCGFVEKFLEESPEAVQLKQWLTDHLGGNHPRMQDIGRMENRNRFLRKLEKRKQ